MEITYISITLESIKLIIHQLYVIMKNNIYLILMLLGITSFAQEKQIVGKVTSNDGEGFPGVSILEKGTNNGVLSGCNGNYELVVTSKDAVLIFSFLRFTTQEIEVGDQKVINIGLEEDITQLADVVVSGFAGVVGKSRKRTESIQNIPESVTALNSKGIENTGVNNLQSFALLVPNLKVNTSQSVGTNFINVRGIPQIRNADAPVAFVIDGVTIPDPSLFNQELFDLALIEAVKGPQGALYGKNAIGGAINIYTKEPINTMKNIVKVGYGSGNELLAQLISSGAIVKDKLFYRLSEQYKFFDGLLTNDFLNKKVDFSDDINIRGQLIYKVSNHLKLSGTMQYLTTKAGAAYYSVNPTGNTSVLGEPGGPLSPDPEEGNNIITSDEFGRSDIQNIFGNINLETGFEKVKFQSITSVNKIDRSLSGDLDFTPVDNFTQGEKSTTKTFNQELRFRNVNSSSKINWNAGGFFQNIEKSFFQDGLRPDFNLNQPFYAVAAHVVNTTRTIALFGFLDYKLSEKLTASVGCRFDNDKFTQDDLLLVQKSSRTNNIIQPKVSLSYKASKAVLFYTNYGRGYRTGGFNPMLTYRVNKEFDDELTDNFEFGFKTSWWNNRFILNGTVFYTDFTNRQQYVLDSYTSFVVGIYNYDKSQIKGFELDTKVRLSKFLDVLFNVGVIDSEITEGGSIGGTDKTDLSIIPFTNLNAFNGKKTPFVPVSNYNIGLQSSVPLSDEIELNAFVNLNNTGKTYWSENNDAKFTTSAYKLLDAKVSLSVNNWVFTLWGKNILNQQYYQEYVSVLPLFGRFDDFGWRGRPASFGTSITVRFNSPFILLSKILH